MNEKAPKQFINFISGSGSTNLAILQAEKEGVLTGVTRTVAIIYSRPGPTSPKPEGVQKAIDFGFPEKHILPVYTAYGNLSTQMLRILDFYKPDVYHQLGWMPWTPDEVREKYCGLNQHFGPGGKWMYGVRRPYAHRRFCEMVKEERPIPIFCQVVGQKYDSGDVIFLRWGRLLPDETPQESSQRILEIEHQVQIEGRRRWAVGGYRLRPLPKIAKTKREVDFLEMAKREARDKYPNH